MIVYINNNCKSEHMAFLCSDEYKVTEFSDAKQLYESFINRRPDIVIIGVVTKESTWLDVAKKIRDESSVPVIIVNNFSYIKINMLVKSILRRFKL